MKYSDLYFKVKSTHLRNLILTFAIKKEGGYPFSRTIREVFERKYNIVVGYGSYGCFDYSHLRPNITIGNYCSFGPGVRIFRANHRLDLFTTHPIAYGEIGDGPAIATIDQRPLIIGNDVWVGANAIILPKCTYIGDGAVIGAGSIVTANVEPYTVVAGNPAHLIRERFTKKTIEALQMSEWWTFSMSDLSAKMNQIQQIVNENEQ